MPTLSPGYFDVDGSKKPVCTTAIVPDALNDNAVSVTWLSLIAIAITFAGAIFAS